MGDGRAQQGQARRGPRRDRRAGRYAADRGRCRRSRVLEGDGGADEVRDHHGWSVLALRQRAAVRVRRRRRRLFRSLRRADLDAADVEQHEAEARKSGARIVFSCGSTRCRSSSVFSMPRRKQGRPLARRRAGQGPRARDDGHGVRRYGCEHAGDHRGDDEGSGRSACCAIPSC